MSMPRVIRLGAWRLRVQRPALMTDWGNDEGRNGDRAVRADYAWDEKTIRVKRNLGEPLSKTLLLHELLHAVWEYTGLHANDALGRYEERIISAMTDTLFAVMRDNPALVRYLMEKDT